MLVARRTFNIRMEFVPAAPFIERTSAENKPGAVAEATRAASRRAFNTSARKESRMTTLQRLRYLRVALVVVGITCLALYPLMLFWPSGWTWHRGHSDYPMMIVGIYATLGVFLILAARNPLANLSLIWFTVWSSIVHAGIMAVQALSETGQMGHLMGDVPALFVAAVVLATFTPRGDDTNALRSTAV